MKYEFSTYFRYEQTFVGKNEATPFGFELKLDMDIFQNRDMSQVNTIGMKYGFLARFGREQTFVSKIKG
jgi:hypothetical protein